MPTDFDEGMLTGLLVGEGHFGGDGRQPHVTLRMHERHERLFRWIERTFPGGRLYGPYEHSGRRYYQWMARGSYLRDVLLPMLERRMSPQLDRYAFERLDAMRSRYRRQLVRSGVDEGADAAAGSAARDTNGDRTGRETAGAGVSAGGEAPGAGTAQGSKGGGGSPRSAFGPRPGDESHGAADRIFAALRELDEPG